VNHPDTTTLITGLINDLTYYFRVAAVDEAGNKSLFSNEASATPFNSHLGDFALLTPAADSVIVREGVAIWDSVTFSWEAAEDPDGDSLYYRFEPAGQHSWLFPAMDTNATTISLIPQIDVVANGAAHDTLFLNWNVAAIDGKDTTWSSNGPRALKFAFYYPPSATVANNGLPTAFALHPAYPNPFNPSATIRFDLPGAADVQLVIYDILGREVVRLMDHRLEAGDHHVIWDSKAATGQDVPSGIYIARLVTAEYSKSIKMVLLK
ncbi:MAG: T9SS type A sorting domain-containing protein, partial [Candidatus Neomarinimicrobiota bacterium]